MPSVGGDHAALEAVNRASSGASVRASQPAPYATFPSSASLPYGFAQISDKLLFVLQLFLLFFPRRF